jgi:hypothetical protein
MRPSILALCVLACNSRLHDFNAMIKGNGEGNPYVFPDDVVIEGTELYNSTLRITGNPVFIHDHGKEGGDGISYAAFLKGNSRELPAASSLTAFAAHPGQEGPANGHRRSAQRVPRRKWNARIAAAMGKSTA